MTYSTLKAAINLPLDTRDTVDTWRFGELYRPFIGGRVLATGENVTIRPGESLSDLGRSKGGLIAVIDR